MALDATSEEFIQLLRDARDSVSHAQATAADAQATAADVIAAAASMQTAITKAAESLASANASESSHQASLALYTSLAEVQTEATNTQLRAWEAQAEKMTAESFADEAEDVFVNTYTSNGNGTFTATPTIKYSALHHAAKAAISLATATEIDSVGTNYIKFKNGKVIQWGSVTTPATQAGAVVTFPVPFINFSYVINFSYANIDDATLPHLTGFLAKPYDTQLATIKVSSLSIPGGGATNGWGNVDMLWIAIGRWI